MKQYDPIVKQAAKLTALAYLNDPHHGDRYWFAMTTADGAGTHGATRKLVLACVTREVMIDVVSSDRILETGFCQIIDNVLKVRKVSETAFRKTFGSRFTTRQTEQKFRTYADLPLDPSPCAGPRARTFEKMVCKTIGAKWTGGLNRVQIDGVTIITDADGNKVKIRDEVKGLGGRITAYCPSEVDRDARE